MTNEEKLKNCASALYFKMLQLRNHEYYFLTKPVVCIINTKLNNGLGRKISREHVRTFLKALLSK